MPLFNDQGKSRHVVRLRTVVILFFLILFAIATLFPIYYMIVSSFADPVQAGTAARSLIPVKFTFSSFAFFLSYSKYSWRWLFNSLFIAVVTMVGNVVFCAMAGYAFAKIKLPGGNIVFWLLLCSMMVPYQATQVPLYILVVNVMHMQNTYSALILPSICAIYNVFLAKQFISTLPNEIIECAKMEGCNQFQIFVKIIIPLSATVLAVMAIFTFMDTWNTFFWPFLVTSTSAMNTIQVGLKNFMFMNTTYYAPMMAGATLSSLPMLILFFCLQKYFLQGITVGALKG